jgi:hypothetical protein
LGNIYFERAIANFISFLNHREYTSDQVREVLYDVERENIRQHGYGMHSFALALVTCSEQWSVEPREALVQKSFFESSRMVTGPEFTSSTSIIS